MILILEGGDPYWHELIEWHRSRKFFKSKLPRPKKRLCGLVKYEDGYTRIVTNPDPEQGEWALLTSSPWMRDIVEGWHNGRPLVSVDQIGWDGRWPVFSNCTPTREELESCKDIWERCDCTATVPKYGESYDVSFKVYGGGDR